MAVIGNLAISLSAKTAKFTAGMKKASKRLSRFARSVSRVSRRVATFGIALGAVAATALVIMTKRAFGTIDALAKMARNINISTEALAGFQFAGSIAGVEIENINKSLVRMQKSIGDAKVGLTTAKRAFEQLGLSIEVIEKLSTEKQFKVIADAMQGVEIQSDKARIAMDIFGRTGIKLIEVLKIGSKGLDEFKKNAIKLGIAISEIEAKKIEDANDAITRAKAAFQGLINQFAVKIAPLIEKTANAFTGWALSGGSAAEKVTKALSTVIFAFGQIFSVIKFGAFLFSRFVIGINIMIAGIAKAFVSIPKIVLFAFEKLFGTLSDIFIKLRGIPLVGKLFEDFGTRLEGARKEAAKLNDTLSETGDFFDEGAKKSIEFTKEIEEGFKKLPSLKLLRAELLAGAMPGDPAERAQVPAAKTLKRNIVFDPQVQQTNALLSEIRNALRKPPAFAG